MLSDAENLLAGAVLRVAEQSAKLFDDQRMMRKQRPVYRAQRYPTKRAVRSQQPVEWIARPAQRERPLDKQKEGWLIHHEAGIERQCTEQRLRVHLDPANLRQILQLEERHR